MDDGAKNTIESGNNNGVARGFFLQDITYGFESLDGFVVSYNQSGNSWNVNSLILPKKQYSIG